MEAQCAYIQGSECVSISYYTSYCHQAHLSSPPFLSLSLPTSLKVLDLTSSPQHSPSSSTDREPSYTPKSLSPTPSPLHSHTCTPFHSASSTPSPTPPPSPNLPRRGPTKKQILDPRPASISLPLSRPQGEVVVTPKFMINDVPTSPPQEAGPSKKFTVESFLGKTPAASIHVSHLLHI